jgi:hypothetical protein
MTPKEVDGFAYLCKALTKVDSPAALSVLDPATGKFLEHHQLRRDPRYKTTWDTSYANELGRLCQGIGTGAKPGTKRVDGPNTFFCIEYNDISAHKRKQICHTLVICEVCPDKDDPDSPRITIGGSKICYPGDVGTNTALLKLVRFSLTVYSLERAHASAASTSRTSILICPCWTLSMFRSKILNIPEEFIDKYIT